MDIRKFERIRGEYTKRRSRLILAGRSQRPTSNGYWATSNPSQVFELFKKINLQDYGRFVDLGSGDGVVVAIASLFTKATGIESDEKLHEDAVKMRGMLKLDCKFINSDYLEQDLSVYDIIFINPDNYFHVLEKKLVENFKGKIVITDNIFRPLTLIQSKNISVMGAAYSVYDIG